MIELLKLLGYEEQELSTEVPRVKKVFDKLGITASDIERGKQRVRKYYAIELVGIRKVFRFIVRELVNSLLAREEGVKKLIYGFMCPGIDLLSSALVSKSQDVYSLHQSWSFHIVVGCIFGKLEPVLEEAEKKWLKSGMVAHCANVKTLLGPLSLGYFPKPDLLITSGFLCETAPKTLDLLYEFSDIPVVYIDTCHDRELRDFPDATLRTAVLAAKSMRKVVERTREIVGFEISDELLLEVQDVKSKFEEALGRVKSVLENSIPLTISPAHDNIFMCLNGLSLSISEIKEAIGVLNLLHDELKQRIDKGIGIVGKEAPRILAMCPMGQTDPRLEQLACELDIAIVAIDVYFSPPPPKNTGDPYLDYFLKIQNAGMSLPVGEKISLIVEGCKRLKIEGVLNRYHVGCRAVAGDALLIESAIRKELGIPVMLLEWENFDPRVYKEEEYKRRLEAFKVMMATNAKRKRYISSGG